MTKQSIRFNGAVYTPPTIASSILSAVKKMLPSRTARILEPSIGDGVFLQAIESQLTVGQITAIDIDSHAINQLKHRLHNNSFEITYLTEDFISYVLSQIKKPNRSFDLIIGNPPFIRKHNFSDDFKKNLADFSDLTNYPLKDLKNSWVAFLIASSEMVCDDGIVAFILPYELLTVDYGQKALESLLTKFECIDIYISKNKAFPNIDQDAVVFIGQKQSHSRKGLFINQIDQMSNLSSPEISKIDLQCHITKSLELNSFLLPSESVELLKNLRTSCLSISDYAGSAPGIVSAANDFFIIKKQVVVELGLEEHVLPILKKGSFTSHIPTFTREDFSKLEENSPCYLLNVKGSFDILDENVKSYIRKGEEKGLHLRFKCKNRKNWFEVPIIPREQGFFFKRSHELPRICLNEANVYLTDTAYGLRLHSNCTMKGLCFSFYNSFTMLFAETNGRFYGGGVLELSPKEFRSLPLVYHEPTDEEFSLFLKAHQQAKGKAEEILDFGDQWVQKKLNLSDNQMKLIRQAWVMVRSHRMRHGSHSTPLQGHSYGNDHQL